MLIHHTYHTQHTLTVLNTVPIGAIAVKNGLYGDPAVQQVIGNVGCTGTEPGLLDCNSTVFGVNQPANCDPIVGEAAAVCQGMAEGTVRGEERGGEGGIIRMFG